MNRFGLEFHHLGLAVPEPTAAFHYLQALGYRAGATCFDDFQRVNLAMRHHDKMPDVEVIWPGDKPSPIDKIIKQHGSLVYHVCYTSHSVEESIAAIENSGLEILCISDPEPAPLFEGLEVSFYSVTNVGIIEIIQLPGNGERQLDG